jgi:acetyl-CoA synthetase
LGAARPITADFRRRWAHYLRKHGIEARTRVTGFLPKGPALLSLVLAVWRLGAVYVPLFTAFGAEAVSYRLNHSGTAP